MSSRISIAAAAFGAVLISQAARAQQVVQFPLPYNADIVREVGGTITGGGVDGRGFVTQGEAVANDAIDPHGLPDDGVLQVPGGAIQLGPYNGNNVLRFGNFGTSYNQAWTPMFFIPFEDAGGRYQQLDIYAAGVHTLGNFGAPVQMFVQTSQGLRPGPRAGFNWMPAAEDTTPVLVAGLDTTGGSGQGFQDSDAAAIQRFTYRIPAVGEGPLPQSMLAIAGISDELGPQSVSIFAITLTRAVPEPSAAVLVFGLGALAALRRRR